MNCPFCGNNLLMEGVEFQIVPTDGKEPIVATCKTCGFPLKTLSKEEEIAFANFLSKVLRRKKV